MSFGSSGGFGGFGTNNQQQQNTGFGGFGTNTNNNNTTTTGGFGTPANTGFGSTTNTAGGSLFGGTTANNSSGFGSGGFGSTTQSTSGFGAARPAFGASTQPTSTGGLFGSGGNTSTGSGFGGFGTTQTNNTAPAFGATNTGGGGLFGQNNQQTGFGSSAATGSTMFGGAATNTFGNSTGSNTGFGQATTNTGFGATATTQNTGTGGTPFTEHQEKDASSTVKYQSITCLPQYQGWSFEELRTVDYTQGRKFGNQNGQAGAFGTSTGFGGFGQSNTSTNTGFGSNTGGSLFGQQPGANPAGGFGATQPATTGFGQSSTGGLFGQNKPATTGLFGNTPSSTAQSTGLFGTSGNTGSSGGFGSGTTTNLFGQNNQNKSIFGQTNNTPGNAFGSTTAGGFGQPSTTTGSNLFGATNNQAGAFGQQSNAQTSSPFGGFGQNNPNQQNQNQPATGGIFGGGPFGQNQNKTPFGTNTTTTGTSLFGQPQQQAQPSSLFGNNNQQTQQSSTLFGAKPATGGTSLFGGAPNNNNTGTNLFGGLNNQNQQNQGTSLFGQAQQKPSLFGGNNNTTANNTSLFGGSLGQNNTQTGGNSIFGNTQNQQPQLGSSIFGNSMLQNSQQPQQNQQLTTSIMSNNPYGNDHLFASLGTPTQAVGPLATPLSSSQKARRPAPLPFYKLNPAASTRLTTPQKRSGYGFEYSLYGTPGSAASTASPGVFGSSLLQGGRLGSNLGRSLSATNIRSSPLIPQDSILNPGAFGSSTGLRSGSAGLKRLNINRGIRQDLFQVEGTSDTNRPSPPKKTVSFSNGDANDQHNDSEAGGHDSTSKALVPANDNEGPTPTPEEQGLLRSSQKSNSTPTTNGSKASTDMEQTKGKELAIVPENDSTPPVETSKQSVSASENARLSQTDQEPGEYYMTPSLAELKKMSRTQLSKFKNLVVGRQNIGKIEFGEADLNQVELDKICGDIVRLEVRSATVYADHSNKPAPGKGLNVPSKVTLDNSWPRSKGGRLPVFERKGPRFDKHLDRLHRVEGTHFIDYIVETGQWIFRVDHFSTYGLDYGEDEDDNASSILDSPTPLSVQRREVSMSQGRSSQGSSVRASSVDDTFEFRRSRGLPGAFDQNEQEIMEEGATLQYEGHSHLEERRMSSRENGDDFRHEIRGLEEDVPMSTMLESYDGSADYPPRKRSPTFGVSRPKSILKDSQYRVSIFGTPSRAKPAIGADWATQLQRTISPKKQNRQALRESQAVFTNLNTEQESVQFGMSTFGRKAAPFATSIDVMNSLFGNTTAQSVVKGKKQSSAGKGFQYPYAKRSKPDSDTSKIPEQEKAFHNSFKPSWISDGTLVYGTGSDASLLKNGILVNVNEPMVSDGQDVHFARFSTTSQKITTSTLKQQRDVSRVVIHSGISHIETGRDFDFADFATAVEPVDESTKRENTMWQLASILFDSSDVFSKSSNASREIRNAFDAFWKNVIASAAQEHFEKAASQEEKAIALLSSHEIWSATDELMKGKNFRLATMVAQIGGSETIRREVTAQINEWRERDDLSEITPAIRTLYDLIAGNTCVSIGKAGSGRENKAETFNISSKFGLDWKRAFGLKFWYGTSLEEPVATSIRLFWEDLVSSREKTKPIPWFVEQNIDMGWNDRDREKRQDILWGLMQIYASLQNSNESSRRMKSSINLGDIIAPQNLTGTPMDARLSFQLYRLLSARQIIDFDELDREHKADILTTDYAFQLAASSENLCDAVFVTLHLHDSAARRTAVMALLNRHASVIGEDENTCEVFKTLTSNYRIPSAWIWTAKAVYAKAILRDDVAEVRCLLRAGEMEQAHEALRKTVAPKAVIEEDLQGLASVLDDFNAHGAASLPNWHLGGRVYADFVSLMLDLATEQAEKEMLVKRLVAVLPEISEAGLSLEQRVAITEMGEAVAKLAGSDFKEARTVLVSMEGDRVLQNAVGLSEAFYAAVKVGSS